MEAKQDMKISNSAKVKSLEIGQSTSFPIEKLFSIRTLTSSLNTMRGCKSLTTEVDKESRTITVNRIA